MRPKRHRPVLAATTGLAVVLVLALAGSTLAKEGMQARLDAPIDPDTPGGTELLVGMTVSVPEGDILHPVQGSPIYLRLVAPDGTVAEQLSRDETEMGHYVMRIVVPEGGIAGVEVVLRGTTDLPLAIVGDALAPAQAVPAAPVAPAAVPDPAPVAPPAPESEVGPVAGPAVASAADSSPWPAVLAGAALLALAGALAARLLAPRARRGGSAPDPGVVSGR